MIIEITIIMTINTIIIMIKVIVVNIISVIICNVIIAIIYVVMCDRGMGMKRGMRGGGASSDAPVDTVCTLTSSVG